MTDKKESAEPVRVRLEARLDKPRTVFTTTVEIDRDEWINTDPWTRRELIEKMRAEWVVELFELFGSLDYEVLEGDSVDTPSPGAED